MEQTRRPSLRGRPCCVWSLPSGAVPSGRKGTLLRIGLTMTRHPRMGAAQQPEVAVRELTENKRLIDKDVYVGVMLEASARCCRGTH
jgi:hypothetical protein